jgi:hypothetical protein
MDLTNGWIFRLDYTNMRSTFPVCKCQLPACTAIHSHTEPLVSSEVGVCLSLRFNYCHLNIRFAKL